MPVQIVVRRGEEMVKEIDGRGQDLLEKFFVDNRGN